MTRDEAIKKVAALLWGRRGTITVQSSLDAEHRATEAVDIAVALGLKLDEPRTIESEVADCLTGAFFYLDSVSVGRGALSPGGRKTLVGHITSCGFKIVRSD